MRQTGKRKCIYIALLLTMTLPLAGCWDTTEPERMVYVHGLGIDYKDQQYTVYLQILNPRLLAKSEVASGASGTKVEVGRASGKTIDDAIFKLYKSSQRRIFWGHLSFVLFTEEALKAEGIQATTDLLDRYRETRYRLWMYATNEPLLDVLTAVPIMEMSTALSRLSDPLATYEQSSFVKPIDMRELFILLNEPPYEANIPYINLIKENIWKTEKKSHPVIQIKGIASIKNKKLQKVIKNQNIYGLRWMTKDMEREALNLSANGFSDVSLLINKVKVKIKPIVKQSNIQFAISIKADAVLRENPKDKSLKKIMQVAEQTIKQQVKETYLHGVESNIDIYRLSEMLYRKNVQAWKNAEQNGKVPLTEDSIQKLDVQLHLIHGEKNRKRSTIK
ncbi:Ger(x)C family spore germination protein [Peribacillus asahii]|uniref:Ger(X)C family spore germination protein n=1 Tax=Peribacillus asahii TaxID=228899 RepID=A0A398B1E5_9BACI|nr:Ger(x)C family spore germination protein [Peribacillus asahii]RID82718.1 Ger(x)C family spore germination protein [Peribacillus asahii]